MSCKFTYIERLTDNQQAKQELYNLHNTIFSEAKTSGNFRPYADMLWLPLAQTAKYNTAKNYIRELNTKYGFPVIGTTFNDKGKEHVFVNVRNFLPSILENNSIQQDAFNFNELERQRGNYSEEQRGEFFNTGNIQQSNASPKTIKLVTEFAKRIGVDIETLSREQSNAIAQTSGGGKNSYVYGVADFLQKTVWILEGKDAEALTEENMHFAVAIIKQVNPSLYKEMFNKIGSYKIYDQVKNDPLYSQAYRTQEGNLDIPKLKEEAITKLLTEYLFKAIGEANLADEYQAPIEGQEKLAYIQEWWNKVLEFFKQLFQKDANLYEQIANSIVEGTFEGTVEDIEVEDQMMFNLQNENPKQSEAYNKLKETHDKLSLFEGKFKINDKQVKTSIERLRDENREFKPAAKRYVDRGQEDIAAIMKQYIDENGSLRENALALTAIPQLDKSTYNALYRSIGERLRTYPEGTKFMYDTYIYNPETDTAGKVDFLAIKPNGKLDLLTWELLPHNTINKGDIKFSERETIQKYIGALKGILRQGYNLRDFDQSRGIPMRINYSSKNNITVFQSLTIGSVKIDLTKPEFTQPIPTLDERTGDEKIDKYLNKLTALYKEIRDARVLEGRRDLKSKQLASLYSSIRHLQIDKNFSPLVSQAASIVDAANIIIEKHAEEFLDKDVKDFTREQINAESTRIVTAINSLQLYRDIDTLFEAYFDNEADLKDMAEIATNARKKIAQLEQLNKIFISRFVTTPLGVFDILKEEKAPNIADSQFRVLSGQQNAALRTLYKLNNSAKQSTHFELTDTINELEGIYEELEKASAGDIIKYTDKLYSKTKVNKLIDKFDSDFYKELKDRIGKKDIKWIKANVDKDRFEEWTKSYTKTRQSIIDETSYVGDEEAQERQRKDDLADMDAKTDLSKSSAWLNYDIVKRFPTTDWYSKEYKEITGTPLETLFSFIEKWNKIAAAEGYIDYNKARNFLPFIRLSTGEGIAFNGLKGLFDNMTNNFFSSLTIDDQAVGYGHYNSYTGELENTIPIYFTNEENANQPLSKDLIKNLAVYINQVIDYKNKKDIEGIVRSIGIIEKNKESLVSNLSGRIKRDLATQLPETIQGNEANYKMFSDYVKNTLYGQRYVNSESSDIILGSLGKGYNTVSEKLNEWGIKTPILSKELTDRKVSAIKLIDMMNRFFSFKILGFNPASAMSQLVGGNLQGIVNSGTWYNPKEWFKAEMQLSAHSAIRNDESLHLGLMQYFMPIDETVRLRLNALSLKKLNRGSLSDILMFMMRKADHMVQYTNFLAMMNNAVVIDGKLQNARVYLRSQPEYANKYSSPESVKETSQKFEKDLEKLIEENGIAKHVEIKDGKLDLKGVSDESRNQYRGLIANIGAKAAGNILEGDEMRIRLQVAGRSFMVFKNWIPGLFYTRFQGLSYNSGIDQYEWGRTRMLAKVLFREGFMNIGRARNMLIANAKGIDSMKALYEAKKKDYFERTNKELQMTEAEFMDLVRQNLKNAWRDSMISLALVGMLLAIKAYAPDDDEDPEVKSQYNYFIRIADKVNDEMTFFYNPIAMQSMVSGNLFPALGVLTDATKILTNIAGEMFGLAFDNEDMIESAKPMKYTMKSLPILKEAATYMPLYAPDYAKELGLQMNPNSRSR